MAFQDIFNCSTETMGIISQKHTNFVKEPMKDKPVKDLAGIGKTYEKRLAAVGFDKVRCNSSLDIGNQLLRLVVIRFSSFLFNCRPTFC